jgi:AraC-like DNA-binding protein
MEKSMVTDILCQIHYCNGQKLKDTEEVPYGITRTLQHHAMIFVCEGNGNFVIGGSRYPLKKGMLFYIPPGVPHTIEPRAHNPKHYMTVHFSGSRMILDPDGKWKYLENIQTLHQLWAQKITDYAPLEELFKELLDTWNNKGPSYEFVAATYLRQLFIWLTQNNIKQSKNHAMSLKIDQTIEYMRQNINRKVTLEELSGKARVSTFYLSRAFKEATGYPIIMYFNKMKIDKAKELFIEGNKKVKEVAYELGYTNEFYFSRIFKRIEGLSPSEFYSKNVYEF